MRLNYYPLVNISLHEAMGSDAGDDVGISADKGDGKANSVDADDGSSETINIKTAEPLGVSRHTDSGALTVLLQVTYRDDGMG